MQITKKLWEDNYEIALLSLNTKFVQGLKNGSLPKNIFQEYLACLLYTSPSPRDERLSRMPSSA